MPLPTDEQLLALSQDAAASAKSANFRFDELAERVAKGAIKFKIVAQLANDGDVVDDATVHWPEDRTLLELGTIALTAPVPDSAHEQKQIIFGPIPRLDGIAPSNDPLLELRAAIYLMSGRRRRGPQSLALARQGTPPRSGRAPRRRPVRQDISLQQL
jgi:catalase